MTNTRRPVFPLLTLLLLVTGVGAQGTPPATSAEAPATVLPASDPSNSGGWILRPDISDEFAGDKIDESKWFVEGARGQYYIWKGRAPSQFAPHNVRLEDGKLKLRTQWQSDFDFAEDEGHEGNTYAVHKGKRIPVTTAGVISKKRFLNGYMEVKSKAGDAAMTSSFWAIGYESELDVYEQMGRPKVAKGDIRENMLKLSIHDWSPPAVRPTRKFGCKHTLPFRVADDFHVYGCEWGKDYLKLFVDGQLVYETTQKAEGKGWTISNPLEIWLDSEVFVWLGLPDAEELPVDFEIEYVRLWQKPQTNHLDRAFFGFEGPILFEENLRPLNLVPESSKGNDYQRFWHIDERSAKHMSIVRHEKFASGTKSLKFSPTGDSATDDVSAVAPAGSVDIPAGDYVLSAKVWVEAQNNATSLRISLSDPTVELPTIDLSDVSEGQWITVKRPFTRNEPSTAKDRLTISLHNENAPAGSSSVFIDDISIEAAKM